MRAIARLGSVIGTVVLSIGVTALPVLAQTPTYPPPTTPPGPTEVAPPPPVEDTVAFTGADVTWLLLGVAILLAVGTLALLYSRRRARTA